MDQLNEDQLQAVPLVASRLPGQTWRELAAQMSIDVATLWRWRQDDTFLDAVEVERKRILRAAIPEIQGALLQECRKGNVAAIREAARWAGIGEDRSTVTHVGLPPEFEGRSEAELDFFSIHKYWPEQAEDADDDRPQ